MLHWDIQVVCCQFGPFFWMIQIIPEVNWHGRIISK